MHPASAAGLGLSAAHRASAAEELSLGGAPTPAPSDHEPPTFTLGATPSPDRESAGHARVEAADLLRIALVLGTAGAFWADVAVVAVHPRLLGLGAMALGGYPIFKQAFGDLRARRMTMEVSMTIALAATLVIGEIVTALVISGLVLLADILEALTVSRGRRSIGELLAVLPQRVLVRRAGRLVELPTADLVDGDQIMALPGSRIPVDGTVVDGESFVDQAAITGEPMPAAKRPGTPVFAGTINQSGALEIRAERVGRETRFGQMLEAVERAKRCHAPIQKTADRLASSVVYLALVAAAVTFAVTHDPRRTISVIIVAGACGVAAGTPLVILGAIGRAARQGAILKGGIHLEALWSVDTIVLDKTGTVTLGDVRVHRVYPAARVSVREVLEAAAVAERRSEHPIGRAIVRYAAERRVPPREPARFAAVPGKGVRAECDGEEILVGSRDFVTGGRCPALGDEGDASSTVFVMRGGRYLGAVAVSDIARPDAKLAIDELKRLRIGTHLLTGDSAVNAEAMAQALGVDTFGAALVPGAKLERIETLRRAGHRVAMVGDGMKDAPALSAATVGVAMGSGTDAARESADVVLIGNDLLKFVGILKLARRTHRIVLQNFAGTLTVDVAGIGLAAMGRLNPLVAALIHLVSDLLFLLNSARLIPAAGSAGDSRV